MSYNKLLEILNNKGGQILDGYYITNKSKFNIKCNCGYIWKAEANTIIRGSWCRKCFDNNRRFSLEYLNELSFAKDGYLISDYFLYKNKDSKIEWQCKFNHKWLSSVSNIKSGKWCPYCAKNKKLLIDDAKNIAIKYDAILLSKEYKNVKTNLKWRCKNEHIFYANLNNIKNKGSWCPQCSFYSSESICRLFFEKLFGQKFIKQRPKWLKNSKGNLLELDGLSENTVCGKYIAFEHQGNQHYKENSFFSTFSLSKIKEHDKIKKELCEKNNIFLICIPQLYEKIKINNLRQFILNECNDNNIIVPNEDIKINIFDVKLKESLLKYEIDKIKEIALSKGGLCLSDNYINSITKLKFKCSKNHEFELTANSLKSKKYWCKLCSKENKYKEKK